MAPLFSPKRRCAVEQFSVLERTGLLLSDMYHVYCKMLQCFRKKKKMIKKVFMISDEPKDKEFLSAVNEEQQIYLQRIKELENMVCVFLIVLDVNPLKTNRICVILGLNVYRAVNTLHLGYKNQSVNAV